MLSKTSPEGTQANTYNNLNQLVSSITAGVTSSYTYNVDGIRTSKTVGTTTTDYLLDGGNVVGEVQNGEITATYLRGANLLSTDNGTSTSYYLFNAHGDVTGLTNGAQTVTKAYDYDAFGNEKNPSSTDENPFRYCAEYFDKETGTYYLRARYYDPAIGRFTQQDTHWNTANMIYGDANSTGNPSLYSIMQSSNLYAYCINNPIIHLDSTGKVVEIMFHYLKGKPYNHIDIAINDTIYSFANYKDSFLGGMPLTLGVIMKVNKKDYLKYRRDNDDEVIGFILNYTHEQEQKLLNTLESYIAEATSCERDSKIGAEFYYGKFFDGLGIYSALNYYGINCTVFVEKLIIESGLHLDPRISNPIFCGFPNILKHKLYYSYILNEHLDNLISDYSKPSGSVLEVIPYKEKNQVYYNPFVTLCIA